MELKNLTIAFLGDSITEGVGASSSENCYPCVLERNAGLKEALNYGVSGTRIARQTVPFMGCVEWDRDFVSRINEMRDDVDCVVVCGGINDYMHGDAELGCFEDCTEYTFYGAMHNLCKALIERYPTSLIVIMTPLHRTNEESLVNERGVRNVATLKEYVYAEREVAECYSLPVLDMYAMGSLNPNVPVIKEMYTTDGLHPNDAGHELIAKRLLGFLNTL